MFGQQAALAFAERDALEAYLTGFAFDPHGTFARLLKMLPNGVEGRFRRELARRSVTAVPRDQVETAAFWEVVRTLADKARLDPRTVDRIWDFQSRRFAAAAGRRLRRGANAVYAYEYTALEAFEAADRLGLAKILDFPSLNSRAFQELQRVQKALHPELASPLDIYFEALFEPRQARRDAEMRSADVIITNSSVTRASHIAGGADPARTIAVPYGAPPAVEAPARTGAHGPLRVIWAGTFSIRKGAHLFLDAWRRLDAGRAMEAEVFGAQALPERLCRPAPEGMTFHGSVPQSRLFAAYDAADVLMFPTLSDGFGMVVTEAFSRGVPVITTDQAGASDLVRHEVNGLIIPAGDTAAIAQALQWCLESRHRLAAMRREALETARNWQWRDYRAALYDAVEQGLEGRRRRAEP